MNRCFRALAPASVLLVAACGGGASSEPDAATVDPARPPAASSAPSAEIAPSIGVDPVATGSACALLADAVVTELTTLEVDSVQARSAGGIFENGCYWVLVDATGEVAAEILLGVATPGGRAHYDTYIVPDAAAMGFEPLEGIGDAALIGFEGTSLMAVVGDALVDLEYLSLSTVPSDVPIALIERVLASLADA